MPASLNLASLGRRVRETRLARRLTLESVVARTSFTVSWLSKLENGQLSPSLEGLVGLAEALGCGVESLVEGLSAPPRHVVVRAGNGKAMVSSKRQASRDGYSRNSRSKAAELKVEHLAEGWQAATIAPTILHLDNGSRQQSQGADVERFLMVLTGRVRLEYADDVILLGQGDSIYFDASFPHTIAAAGRTSARVLSVTPSPC